MKMQSWRTFQCDNCTLQASLRRGDDIDRGEGINGGSFRVIHAFMLHAYGNQQNGEDVQKDPRFCRQWSPRGKYGEGYVKECCILL